MNNPADHGNVIPAPVGKPDAARSERSIGTLLIHAGRLTLENAERILYLPAPAAK